jgi:uncharacterized protein
MKEHLNSLDYMLFFPICWGKLCRNYVSGNAIDGITYNMEPRWWGKVFFEDSKDGEMI